MAGGCGVEKAFVVSCEVVFVLVEMMTRGLIVLFVLFVCVLWSKVEGNEIKEGGQVTAYTTHGIMIDAGSDGSRLHVFSWEPVSNNDVEQSA